MIERNKLRHEYAKNIFRLMRISGSKERVGILAVRLVNSR